MAQVVAVDGVDLEPFRRELTGYCYRMLGSGLEADDAVQETMLRAWRAADRFEGRSSVRSWLYRIATNVCIDMQRQPQRRARPMDLQPASPPDESHLGQHLPEITWVTPIADDRILPENADAAEIAAHRDSVRLALISALQHLPPKQRAALILCDVLRWPATEAADLLETTVASVNSALQRARATLDSRPAAIGPERLSADEAEVVARYAAAFERYDIDEIASLLRADAVMSMPPFAMWLQGRENICTWMVQPGPSECAGSKLTPIRANGLEGFAQYRPDPDGGWSPWGIHLLEVVDGEVVADNVFLTFLDQERFFPYFGLPTRLDP
jgi:RNA polymerase sigma-70 factor (ECF subfamily)